MLLLSCWVIQDSSLSSSGSATSCAPAGMVSEQFTERDSPVRNASVHVWVLSHAGMSLVAGSAHHCTHWGQGPM